MSEENSNEEPTMEEILASIRKIISEDDDAPEETSEVESVEPEPEPEPGPEAEFEPEAEPEPEVEPESEEEDILDLTDMLDEEEEVVLEIPEPEPESEPEIEPEPEVAIDISGDEVDPAEGYDAIMSSGPSYDASSQFGMLSELLTTGYQGSGNTLEDLVRELLKPMLRSWLDDNLPPLVERMVAKEIARLARVKKP